MDSCFLWGIEVRGWGFRVWGLGFSFFPKNLPLLRTYVRKSGYKNPTKLRFSWSTVGLVGKSALSGLSARALGLQRLSVAGMRCYAPNP